MSKGKFDQTDPRCEDGGVACNDCICAGQCMSPPKSQPIANLQAAKPEMNGNAGLGIPECGGALCGAGNHHALCNHAQADKPADALGSLPVVAEVVREKEWDDAADCHYYNGKKTIRKRGGFNALEVGTPLTDHAQATEALAKKEAFWKRVVNVADAQTNQYIEKCKALEAKLAGVDGLVRSMNELIDLASGINVSGVYVTEDKENRAVIDRAVAVVATYEAAQGEKQ